MTTAPICFLGIKSDGVHPGRRPWEFAAIRREPDGTEIEWQAFVDIDLATADPVGLRVGRFYERHPLGQVLADPGRSWVDAWGISTQEAARTVAQLTHGAHIVGAVPNFDTETLAPLLRAHRLTPAWHYHLIDIEALCVGWVAHKAKTIREQDPGIRLEPWPSLPWKSDDLGRALGVEPPTEDERHTALGDARWARRVYDAVMSAT